MILSPSGYLGAMVVRYRNRFQIEVYTIAAGQKIPAWKSPLEFYDKELAIDHAEYIMGVKSCRRYRQIGPK